MAEVGVWTGAFARAILERCPEIGRYYMIDPWASLDDWNKPLNVTQSAFDDVYDEAMRNTDFARGRRKVLRGRTSEVAAMIPDASLDFAYIDGDHTLRGVTIANQLPQTAPVDPAETGEPATSSARRIEETTNFEMTRTVRNEVREIGGVRRLSVAVALNAGSSARTPAELERITSLVRAAVGYNPARGDQINVVEAAFSPLAEAAPAAGGTAASAPATAGDGAAILRAGEIAAFAAVIVALLVFVLRPLLSASQPAQAAAPLASPLRATALPAPGADDAARPETSLRRVADIVKTNTDESAGILKDWIRKAS